MIASWANNNNNLKKKLFFFLYNSLKIYLIKLERQIIDCSLCSLTIIVSKYKKKDIFK